MKCWTCPIGVTLDQVGFCYRCNFDHHMIMDKGGIMKDPWSMSLDKMHAAMKSMYCKFWM